MGNENQEAVSGMIVEEQKFTWRIQNFSVVKSHDALIKAQKFEFEAGGSIGLSTKWRIHLDRNEYRSPGYIGIHLERLTPKPTANPSYLIAECSFKIMNKDGTLFLEENAESRDFWAASDRSYGWGDFLDKTGEIPLVEDCLIIYCKFRLYASAPPLKLKKLSIDDLLEQFHSGTKANLVDLTQLPVSCSGGIEICSSDGKQFQSRKEVLAIGSPVFEAMFESGMKESAEGKLELIDISSKTVEVLLHYFCTGKLLSSWRQTDVILELTNAAAKYQLQDLLGFLDTALGKVCDDVNVLPLLNLVDKLELKNAKEGLIEFLGRKGFNSREVTKKEQVTQTQLKKGRCCIV